MSAAKTYGDTWKCPAGHSNYALRRIGTAGKKTMGYCARCNMRYTLVAGPVPAPKGVRA